MDTRDELSIGQVAERSGFAASAVRYYESEGLLQSTRDAGGRRRFRRSVLRRLAFIRAASNVGCSLEEIREELDRLPSGRTPTKADWQRISRHWRTRLDERIEALQKLRDGLDSCIGCGCLSLGTCRMSNPQDTAASDARAPGAAFLPAALRRPGGSPSSAKV
ncbi:redox-sensitive transcriptional activator SoxR [Allobranchiibius huperziae]|uniref:MerR family redox-sensitive transcriptional activator SoxR n=1 Tax=Allobranchiibius huperziae TaxID=1874116 RepID=A0A853DLG7_9MICO|nr:redox-sensitive transcriptional activator SoxR [Allobranchiibius huperziae]NYJ75571.1 MerR family redox-sensitive transcriptional activator SoxR [Allobranchiibius huperziae]